MAASFGKSAIAESPLRKGKPEQQARAPETPQPEGLRVQEWETVPIEDIDFGDETFQYRLSTKTSDLRASLERAGQQEPVDLTGKKPHRIIDGFRRALAAKELSWGSIKAFVHRGLSEEEAFRLAFTKNVVRKNLTPLEKAHAMFLAQQRGIEKAEIARTFNMSEKQVGRYLELASFPPEIQHVLDGRTVTMAHARLLAAFAVKTPEDWAKRIELERLDAKALRECLETEYGKKGPGRPKGYLRIGKDAIRLYPCRITRATTAHEREKIIGLLEEAARVLGAW